MMQCMAANSQGSTPQIEPKCTPGLGRSGFFILKCKWILTEEHNDHVTSLLPHPHPPFSAWRSGLTKWHIKRLLGSTVHSRAFCWWREVDLWMESLLPLQASCSMADLTRDWDQSLGDSRMVMRPSFPCAIWSFCPKHPLH